MQLHQLAVFKKVADTRSFSRAGEDLFLSQSTVSTHIANLEEYFGRRLFDRLGKQALLTPFGERLYQWAEKLLALHSEALDNLKDYTSDLAGTLHIAASTVPAQYMAPRIMSAFRKQFSAVTFIIKQGSSLDIAELLIKGQADLGMVGQKYYPDKIAYVPFYQEKLVLVAPPEVKLAPVVSLTEIKDYHFIFRTPGSGTQATVEHLLRTAQCDVGELRVVAYLDSVQAVKQAVRDGLGLAFISELAARDYAEKSNLNVHEVEEFDEERPFYFAYNKSRTLAPYVEEFIATGVRMYVRE
jgi:DNA-binding transcriptional LysR family regulator